MTPPGGWRSKWNSFWFAERYPHALSLIRLFLGATLFLRLTGASGLFQLGSITMQFPKRFWPVSQMHESWHMPYFEWLALPSPFWFARLEEALLVLSVLLTLGLFTRIVAPLTAGLLSYLFLLSQWNHHHHILVFVVVLWILAFSPCGQFYSLDAVVHDPKRQNRKHSILPLRFIQIFVTSVYLFAFLWKFQSGWLTGSVMESYDAAGSLRGPFAPGVVAALGYQGLSLSTLIIEGLLPVALWVPALRRGAIALGLLLHLGIDATMDVNTYSYQMMVLYIAFTHPHARSTIVLYDGRCGMCRSSRRWATLFDWLCRVEWLSFREAKVREMVPQLTEEQMAKEMWVIRPDGRMLPGFAGWRYLLNSFPLTFLPSWLLYLPGVSWAGTRLYQFVADRRNVACEVPRPAPAQDDVWQETLQRAQKVTR